MDRLPLEDVRMSPQMRPPQWHFGAAQGGFRPKKRNSAGLKDSVWVYTHRAGESKMEIPDDNRQLVLNMRFRF
jgi:hypothetical protein